MVVIGVYRIALHTIIATLTTGTIKGAISGGITAYSIPKVDEYLTKQGYTKQVRDITLLALSAVLGIDQENKEAESICQILL
ncbi:hypothetical protein SAMN02745664_106102 [Moraxella cuniculi DSM 21768]|uniref:Uncharacterized protein n=2 Tax=Moraxella cuniculi TaxID=34061 RepID=A0A1N7EQA4_9GAMM|nr:hypothetical protein SAMN02745664_106102 [Moraxella cuniculi DSM 21768]